jgi:hypothetical protein
MTVIALRRDKQVARREAPKQSRKPQLLKKIFTQNLKLSRKKLKINRYFP